MCPTLWDHMDCSMPGFPGHHQFPELAQTQVHWVSDAIQPSHPLLFPFPPAFNLSQDQGLFQLVTSSHQVAKVLEFKLQHQSLQWIFRVDLSLGLAGLISLLSKELSRVLDNSKASQFAPQFKSINSLVLSLLCGPILTSIHDYWTNYSFDYTDLCQQRGISAF